ncbi:MAG: PAS domain-containing protein, partial [Campylobacterota bacterium]
MNKKFTSHKPSLLKTLILITTGVIVFSMALFAFYTYTTDKSKTQQQLNQNSKLTLQSLQQNLAHFLDSYSVNEYKKLIENEMGRESISAIIVDDYNMASIVSQKFILGKVRNENGSIEDYDTKNKAHQNILAQTYLQKSAPVRSASGKELGSVTLYISDAAMQQKLQQMLINNLIVTLFIILFLTAVLLVLVRKYLINPITTLVAQMDNTDKNGIPLHFTTDTGSQEISILAKTIEDMSKTIEQSQESLRKEKERFALAIEGSNDGIWDWDIVNHRIYLSPRWQELLGYFDHDFTQSYENFRTFIHPDDRQKVTQALDDNLNRKKDEYHCEFRMKHKNGGYVWILARAKIKFDASGKPLRMAGSHTDITKQKELEESLETKVQEQIEDIRKKDELIHQQARLAAMGEMIGAIAHQWRQPLNAVSINIQNLDDDYEDGLIDETFIQRFIQKNSRIIEFMSKTIDDFRNFF